MSYTLSTLQMPKKLEKDSLKIADTVPNNWVNRYAPQWAKPYLYLSRADRPIGTWLLLLPCWWSILLACADQGFELSHIWPMLACGGGAWLMRGAGCTWNDFCDRALDAKVARTRHRPLPSGQITPQQALIWMGAQAFSAFFLLLTFPLPAILLGLLSLVPLTLYPFAKRFTWWPQIFLGMAFNWGALLGWAASGRPLEAPAFILYAAGIAWTLFYDTIYAYQDIEDDALIGIKSTARFFGKRPFPWLIGFSTLSAALMSAAIFLAFGPEISGALMLGLAGSIGFFFHQIWQLRKLDIAQSASCLTMFRANRDTGLIPVVFFACAALL